MKYRDSCTYHVTLSQIAADIASDEKFERRLQRLHNKSKLKSAKKNAGAKEEKSLKEDTHV